MKPLYISLVLLLSLGACNKDIIKSSPFCNVTDPIQDLPWLKTITEVQKDNKYSKMVIFKYEYKLEEGFLVDSCAGCSDSFAIFYNCTGKNICEFDGINSRTTCPDFLNNSVRKEIVFMDTIVEIKPESYFCNVDNPLEDLEWLKIEVDAMKSNQTKATIYRCIYDNNEGFVINRCLHCPDVLVHFFSCDGEILCEFGGIDGQSTCPDFQQKITSYELIFEIK